MKRIPAILAVLSLCAAPFAATHVLWYKCIQNNYNLQATPGPNLPAGVEKHEGMIMSAHLNQRNNAQEPNVAFGSGADDAQGRCAFFWFKDLCDATGVVTSAKIRAEYRDGWSTAAYCNAGPIAIRCGVADFQGNIDAHGSPDLVPETATWADGLYPIAATMGYNSENPSKLMAEETINHIAVNGRAAQTDDSVLDKQFWEVDVTDQANWILAHTGANKSTYSGQYAIVFLVAVGQGSIGKINSYTAENCVIAAGSDNPWTVDGNTCHLVAVGDNLQFISAEKAPATALNGLALGFNQPNPFTKATTLAYSTDGRSATAKIFSADGKLVHTQAVSGQGNLIWNAKDNAPGLYICRLTAGNKTVARTLVLAK